MKNIKPNQLKSILDQFGQQQEHRFESSSQYNDFLLDLEKMYFRIVTFDDDTEVTQLKNEKKRQSGKKTNFSMGDS